MALVTICDSMKEQLRLDPNDPATIDRADELNVTIGKAMRKWLKVKIVGKSQRPSTLAFLLAVLQLAKVDLGESKLVPLVSFKPTKKLPRKDVLLV